MVSSFGNAVKDWARLVRDLGRILLPPLFIVAIPAGLFAVAFSKGLIL